MTDNDRALGVELGDLGDKLESHNYPATQEELVEAYGDETVEYDDGDSEEFGELIGRIDVEEFTSAQDVNEMLMTAVPTEATGGGHSGRGAGTAPDEETDSV
jgi:hypothetical protein